MFASQNPGLVELQREGRLAHGPRALAELLRSAGQGAMEPVWDRLPELTIPVLLVAGEQDERYADAAERMAALMPGARLAIVRGAGHAPQLEAPRETAELLLEFLDEHFGDRLLVNLDP